MKSLIWVLLACSLLPSFRGGHAMASDLAPPIPNQQLIRFLSRLEGTWTGSGNVWTTNDDGQSEMQIATLVDSTSHPAAGFIWGAQDTTTLGSQTSNRNYVREIRNDGVLLVGPHGALSEAEMTDLSETSLTFHTYSKDRSGKIREVVETRLFVQPEVMQISHIVKYDNLMIEQDFFQLSHPK